MASWCPDQGTEVSFETKDGRVLTGRVSVQGDPYAIVEVPLESYSAPSEADECETSAWTVTRGMLR